MSNTGIISLLLVIANFAFSYKGFTNQTFFDGYKFEVDKILVSKDYKRLITSGFLHINWTHLIFNMISLLAFGSLIEGSLGWLPFIVIYFSSLLGGDLLCLFIHRNHGGYSAVGASGAICGVIFSSIALFPGTEIGFFLLPFYIPGWIYGIIYVLYSIYGIRSKKGNIGHEAHLGGALVGMIVALCMEPAAVSENLLTILLITIPTITFICLIILKPHFLLVDNYFYRTQQQYYSVDHKYNYDKNIQQAEVDKILDKISKSGMGSLTSKEKQTLKQYSQKRG